MKSGTIFKEYPSGKVLCCLRHDQGSINCLSDSTHGDYESRAQEALQKAREVQAAMQYPKTVEAGQIVDVVV